MKLLKPIKDFEGLYSINRDGEVWSYRYKKFLKPLRLSHGYLGYCLRNRRSYKVKGIHRLIAETFIPNTMSKQFVDHINRDKLDNRVVNLRWCTKSENSLNREKCKSKAKKQSKYKGVSWDTNRSKWIVFCKGQNRTCVFLGRFDNEKEAGIAYNEYAKKYYGKFTYLNQVD